MKNTSGGKMKQILRARVKVEEEEEEGFVEYDAITAQTHCFISEEQRESKIMDK